MDSGMFLFTNNTGAWINHKSSWALVSPLYLSWILYCIQVEERSIKSFYSLQKTIRFFHYYVMIMVYKIIFEVNYT